MVDFINFPQYHDPSENPISLVTLINIHAAIIHTHAIVQTSEHEQILSDDAGALNYE